MTEFPVLSTTAADEAHFERSSSSPSSSRLPHPLTDPTLSYWIDTSSAPSSRYGIQSVPSTEDDTAVDVAIIGSGITGVSAAYHLLHELGTSTTSSIKSIVVFEAREFCSGATGRNGGHLTPVSALAYTDIASNPAHLSRNISTTVNVQSKGANGAPLSRTDDVVRRILTLEQRTASELISLVQQEAKHGKGSEEEENEDVELVNKKNWHLCFTPSEEAAFESSLQAATQAGLSDFVHLIRKVSQEECNRALSRPIGVLCAFEIPGSTLHPRRLVAALWRAAFRRASSSGQVSLKMYTHTPIERISYPDSTSQATHSVLHTTQGKRFRARFVVHATNAYISHLAPQLAGPKHGVVPTRAQCISALPSIPSPSPAATATTNTSWDKGISLHSGYEYLHQRPPSKVPLSPSSSAHEGEASPFIFGGGRYLSDTMEYDISNDGSVHPAISHFLRSFLPSTFPRSFSSSSTEATPLLAPVSHEWTGIIGMTHSKDPLVGPLPSPSTEEGTGGRVERHYVSAGYSGHGMTRAFACARIVAQMVIAEERGCLDRWTVPDWFPTCYLTMLPS
ncbi:unnamed protein product [Tilletia laevis]|uniref:FAD dependent oxidoreductase domain-containing protein n=1 Tax=Tilletia controversa TaxID=13291 RepID=A0A8X7MRD2_9BASI|nr:hypothetical protein CF328_g4996 [Tilletia controversa]KAE8198409.1 hypothetical protein CF335_g4391 [Tilletia laevis]CAD7064704.1 unnamed protein product [Tilletia caries]KAE8245173.1 hypothetical protein A4X06_0g5795 [Tilletia controversa]CAD6913418.1 unnamed protein product [Tilletia controversa]